jgi:hypothetical protein
VPGLQLTQLISLYFLVKTLKLLFYYPEKDVVLVGGQKRLYYVSCHKQLIQQLGLKLKLILKVTAIHLLMHFLLPKELLLKLIQQQPALPDHHFAVLDPQNERKYLHILRQVNIREIWFQYHWEVHKLEPNKLL